MKTKNSILLLFLPFFAWSQQQDFQLWSNLELNYKLAKKVKISLDQSYRIRENATISDLFFTNLSLSYKLSKHHSVALGYRMINDFDLNSNIELKHRYYSDYNYRFKQKRLTIRNRLRFQYQSQNITIRDKASISYNVKKTPFEPFTSFEIYYKNKSLDKWRYTLGGAYPLAKKTNFSVFYRIQKDINAKKPEELYILGIGLDYNF